MSAAPWYVSEDGYVTCTRDGNEQVVHVAFPESQAFDIRAPRDGGLELMRDAMRREWGVPGPALR